MNGASAALGAAIQSGTEDLASRFSLKSESDREMIATLMSNPKMDAVLLDGLLQHLDKAAAAPFVHALKLENLGSWIGNEAPARLQIRLAEIGKSSLHPAFAAFASGLKRSGGLEKAYPPSRI